MENLTLQQDKDPSENWIEMEDSQGIHTDIKFVVDNHVWQNSDINTGLYFIRKKKLDEFYNRLCDFVPEGSGLSRKEFEEALDQYSYEDEDLHEDYYFSNFNQTENLSRQLVNIIDKNQ